MAVPDKPIREHYTRRTFNSNSPDRILYAPLHILVGRINGKRRNCLVCSLVSTFRGKFVFGWVAFSMYEDYGLIINKALWGRVSGPSFLWFNVWRSEGLSFLGFAVHLYVYTNNEMARKLKYGIQVWITLNHAEFKYKWGEISWNLWSSFSFLI